MKSFDEQMQWEKDFMKKIYDKRVRLSNKIDVFSPHVGIDGKLGDDKGYGWTCGFWGGIQWMLSDYGSDKCFYDHAIRCSERMDKALALYRPLGHDVGFQYLHTTVADYQHTGSERARTSSIHAANMLAGRYNIVGKYIRAWNDDVPIDKDESKAGYAIIDCMMNIPILYWASCETGDPRYKHIAMQHADTVMKEFIRQDGSSEHIVVFDPETGEVLRKPAGQGYSEGSSWTRGQAWAIHGFVSSYTYTGKKEYLDTALKVARYFIKQMGEKKTPPVDFMQPKEPDYVDTTAAAIAVSGMIQIQKYVNEEVAQELENAIRTLFEGLYENCCFDDSDEAILLNGSQMYHDSWHNRPIIYGEFYLLEALGLRQGKDIFYFHPSITKTESR